jgi:hypothetical protein
VTQARQDAAADALEQLLLAMVGDRTVLTRDHLVSGIEAYRSGEWKA